jgi:tripartite-type tricarboxylate transporter receptor subunit TctC
MNRSHLFYAIAVLCIGAAAPSIAQEQKYPARPIKMVVPTTPGGGVDAVARLVALHVAAKFGQQIPVENVSGAAQQIGTNAVVRAAADGYTVLFAPPTPITIAEHFDPKPPYDARNDLATAGMIGRNPGLIVINASIPANTVGEFIALAKANPKKYFYGSPGQGHAFHLITELFAREAGIEMTHVPYKGSGPAVVGLIAGDVQFAVQSAEAVKEHLRGGRVRALATLESNRLEGLPAVPTLAQSGLANLNVVNWYGVFLPAKTPRAIIDAWERELLALPKDDGFTQKMKAMNFDPVALGANEFTRMLNDERKQWQTVVKAAGIGTKKD